MSKWFEVVVTLQKVYTVKADSADEALDEVVYADGSGFVVESDAKELVTPEEIDRSIRHGDFVIEV